MRKTKQQLDLEGGGSGEEEERVLGVLDGLYGVLTVRGCFNKVFKSSRRRTT